MAQKLIRYTSSDAFMKSLIFDTGSFFENERLRVEASREYTGSAKAEYKLRFFQKKGSKWSAFGFIISPYRYDLAEAFREELKLFAA